MRQTVNNLKVFHARHSEHERQLCVHRLIGNKTTSNQTVLVFVFECKFEAMRKIKHEKFSMSLFARRDKIIINKVLISQRVNVTAQLCQKLDVWLNENGKAIECKSGERERKRAKSMRKTTTKSTLGEFINIFGFSRSKPALEIRWKTFGTKFILLTSSRKPHKKFKQNWRYASKRN